MSQYPDWRVNSEDKGLGFAKPVQSGAGDHQQSGSPGLLGLHEASAVLLAITGRLIGQI
jgi:hypothetical protein